MPVTTHDLRPGGLVTFPFGAMTIHARVIEDRGHLGIGGRQVVRIEVIEKDAAEPWRFEVPAEEVVLEGTAAK
jgi:hypothetical protein